MRPVHGIPAVPAPPGEAGFAAAPSNALDGEEGAFLQLVAETLEGLVKQAEDELRLTHVRLLPLLPAHPIGQQEKFDKHLSGW